MSWRIGVWSWKLGFGVWDGKGLGSGKVGDRARVRVRVRVRIWEVGVRSWSSELRVGSYAIREKGRP